MSASQEPTQQVIDEFVIAAHGDFAKVKALSAQFPSLIHATARWGETALGAAAHSGQRDVAEFFLARGVPIEICVATMLGRADRVAAFLKADPGLAHAIGAHGIPVLYHAAIGNHTDVAELLVAHGAPVNVGEGGNTALHGAARFGHTRMVEWLLAHGAPVNALDHDKKTPLRLAKDNRHSEAAELLSQHGGTT